MTTKHFLNHSSFFLYLVATQQGIWMVPLLFKDWESFTLLKDCISIYKEFILTHGMKRAFWSMHLGKWKNHMTNIKEMQNAN